MKCVSCTIDIDPKWKHAIEQNICPFCGSCILEEHLKNLLTNLCDTMEKMKQYPDQLNDWMLSNHNYIKTDSEDIYKYMPKDMVKELAKEKEYEDFLAKKNKTSTIKVQTESGEEEVQVIKTQSEEKTNGFFARAEVNKKVDGDFKSLADKTQHIKSMVKQIKKSGSPVLTDESGGGGFLPAEMMEDADPDAVAEMQQMLAGGAEIASSLQDSGDDDIPASVLAMANMSKGSNSNNNDLQKLQQMQARVANAKKSFENGDNRGGRGGGFSRSG
jgi:hypothetical protein